MSSFGNPAKSGADKKSAYINSSSNHITAPKQQGETGSRYNTTNAKTTLPRMIIYLYIKYITQL